MVAKDAVSSVHVQSDSEYRLFEIVSLLGWLKRVPRTWQSTREPSCSWLLGEPLFLSSRSASQAHLPLRASLKCKPHDRRRDSMMLGARVLGQGSLLPLSQGEAFTLASISYLAILVKYILAKKKKKKNKGATTIKLDDAAMMKFRGFPRRTSCRRLSMNRMAHAWTEVEA